MDKAYLQKTESEKCLSKDVLLAYLNDFCTIGEINIVEKHLCECQNCIKYLKTQKQLLKAKICYLRGESCTKKSGNRGVILLEDYIDLNDRYTKDCFLHAKEMENSTCEIAIVDKNYCLFAEITKDEKGLTICLDIPNVQWQIEGKTKMFSMTCYSKVFVPEHELPISKNLISIKILWQKISNQN